MHPYYYCILSKSTCVFLSLFQSIFAPSPPYLLPPVYILASFLTCYIYRWMTIVMFGLVILFALSFNLDILCVLYLIFVLIAPSVRILARVKHCLYVAHCAQFLLLILVLVVVL